MESALGDSCVPKVEEVRENAPIEEERQRLAKDYGGLVEGYLLFSEGLVSRVTGHIPGMDYDQYGHVGIYLGDYEVPPGKTYQVRDDAAAPLKVYRKDPLSGVYEPMQLALGETIQPGDRIIGAVVEMRASGAVFTTVDGMKRESYKTMGGAETLKRGPYFAWKTTNPPPTSVQVAKIRQFVLNKVDLTEQGKLGYWFGRKGSQSGGKEWWDCGSLGEGAYEYASDDDNPLDPTPQYSESEDGWFLRPQEIFDNIDLPQAPRSPQDILTTVRSPVNLHLYDGQGRHLGLNAQGALDSEIPNAYYQPAASEYAQAILIRNAHDLYQLIVEAFDEGSFTLHVTDLGVSTPGMTTDVGFEHVPIAKGTRADLGLGSVGNQYLMTVDQDGDGRADRTLSPTSLKSSSLERLAAGDGNGDGRCSEVDALMALKMAIGLWAANVDSMDVNGDGRVTEVDALQILKWAVAGGQCGGA